ncbi:hypothetical protein [Nocardioides sp. zg-1228]|uniref:hypothetical protein n=1 Tax=Nocardioides sp. zg-1228 TaxID=2763008 RepID=UPI0016433B4A|nr:hypothetical protein [Nocardioides sp. zg-1228]MBC2933063.1 hypothetical protein [Nocardioides sp. zg-1228]QSF56746.1 hypothetical protein JX575_14190 [Nocardioides sp. zg-1228]
MNRITALAATVALAAGSLALSAPAQAAPAAAYKVTAKANIEVAVAKEDTVKVRGRVTPKAAGQKVVLQQRVGKKKTWKVTGNVKVKNNGTYLLKDTPSTPGPREYRVLKPASNGIAKGFSKPVAVEVYKWEKLAYRTSGPRVNLDATGVLIGADYFGQSLATTTSGEPASVEYTLGRKCTALRATYALTDSSATGSSGAVTVSADGAVLATHPLAVGTVVADEVLDLSGVFRLKIDLSTTATPVAVAAVATPEVLCTR